MPINTNLNAAPYFDDFDFQNQYYRVLFKPGYAIQAREMTQLQTMLQSQIEQFGDNIFKEGSIVKGCNFTQITDLKYVKVKDAREGPVPLQFDPTLYISRRTIETINGQEIEVDYVYELEGETSGLKANVISATRGFETRSPNLNTFFINYLNTNESSDFKVFQPGETLSINLYKYKVGVLEEGEVNPFQSQFAIDAITVSTLSEPTGRSYGLKSSPGVIFQKGHFLFADEQTLVISKYTNAPDGVSVGYRVEERLVNALQDARLYDNANGSNNENAPGADRLKLTPVLTVLPTEQADNDSSFFTLIRYEAGSEVTLRDVSQYNVLGEELARRTYEESGNYILSDFNMKTDRRGNDVKVLVGTGVAYVKGYRIENSGERSFTIDQIANTETQQNQPISFDYGSYVDVLSYNGWIDLGPQPLDLLDDTDTKIGQTFVSNVTPNRVYLFATRMNSGKSFNEVVKLDGPNGHIVVANESTSAIVKETKKTPLIFDTGMFSVKNATDIQLPSRVVEQMTQSSNQIQITANPGENFALNNDDVVVIDSTSTRIGVLSVSTSLNNSLLTINLDPADGATANVTVYYNKKLESVQPHSKIQKETHVKVVYSSGKTKYNLGFPDVFSIVSIVDSSGKDYTDSFRLNQNQKDQFYDLSFIEYISGRPVPTNGVELTIKLKVFELNTSVGRYFFTISSYPSTISSSEIPVYKSTNGIRYNLRECFDFRPYCDKDSSANYNITEPTSAPLISADVGTQAPTFYDYGIGNIPPTETTATADLEYYLSRIDMVTVDSYGRIGLIKGEEERFATPPKIENDQLAIGQLTIPGFPALSSREAAIQNKREYGIKTKSIGTKRYTMKELQSLEQKVDRLTYYTSLNQLESETENLTILDEQGFPRFKNGFVVDPFNDLALANIGNPKFNAAVPFNQKILTPSLKTFPLNLVYKALSNVTVFPPTNPKVATLSRDSDVAIISQPYATEFRNCVSNFYKYDGVGFVSPPYDATYDTTTNPLNLEVDLTTPFEDFIDNLQSFVPLTDTAVSRTSRFTETTTRRELVSSEQTTIREVGEFVTNFQFEPYMASRDIKIYMSGLRPNTRHYFFFDQVDVNAFVCPGSLVDSVDDIKRNGSFGSSISTDENGVLRAVFNIPEETFFVGDRVMEVVDVDQYESIDSASTSKGTVTYRAYNFSVQKAALTTTTRAPNFDIATTTTTRNLPRRPLRRGDPLAQTFFIKSGMGKNSNSVFVSKIDLYFKRKGETNGVTVMLREVVNGYPSNQILSFSSVHYKPSQVNVSDDASVATTFEFIAPVRLDVEKEYCVVVMPDANDPNYLIFTSKVGGLDLSPGPTKGQPIVQDWGDGVLFTSTNNRAWKSYQDEDVKFKLHRHNFNASSGSITLGLNDVEFLTVSDFSGRYKVGETIYQEKVATPPTSPTVSIVLGSNQLSGTSLDSTYSVGDFILVQDSGETQKDIFKVVSIVSASQIIVDKPASFAIQNGTGTPIVVGTLVHYDKRAPSELHLEESSAKTGRKFEIGELIIGFDSGTTSTLDSVNDIQLSYIQPMIFKANDSVSTTKLKGSFVSPNDVDSSYQSPLKFNDNNYFNQKGVLLYSKSNDLSDQKPFNIIIDLDNEGNQTSTPFVDIEISKLLAYQFNVTNNPETSASYISKTIELAENLDAEDLHLILTAYRPQNSDIKVYIRPQNAFDSDNFESIEWIEMKLSEGVEVFSSSSNLNDYREFKYIVSDSNKDSNGTLTYTSNAGTFFGYRKFAIRIDLLSDNVYNVPTLKDYRGIALT